MTACPDLPALTFPDEVVTFLRKEYEKADVILEFGSGGSTFLAAGQPGKTIVSVESDPAWAQRMRDIAAAHPLPSPPRVIHADIGPVLPWARALDSRELDRFRDYWHSVWDDWTDAPPELVLVDGRFRAACYMATWICTPRAVRVLFDDYGKRAQYHVIERLGRPVKMVGRMAVFDIDPARREDIAPWLLLSTYLDAVTSFKVGPEREKIKPRDYPRVLRAAIDRVVKPPRPAPRIETRYPLRRLIGAGPRWAEAASQ